MCEAELESGAALALAAKTAGAIRTEMTGQWRPCADVRRSPSQGAAPSEPEEEIQEAPPDLEEETWDAPSDPEKETKDVAGLAAGSTD